MILTEVERQILQNLAAIMGASMILMIDGGHAETDDAKELLAQYRATQEMLKASSRRTG